MKSKYRLHFSADENQHDWLGRLLDAYAITDEGVAAGIVREERQGRTLACGKGCASCCRTHDTIPVYPLELTGIAWYVTEKLRGSVRAAVKANLTRDDGAGCPFLVEETCAVHPLRPQACRHFNVFGRACEEGEDAYYSRRGDVLEPIQRFKEQATYTMLPFYGVTNKAERRRAARGAMLDSLARPLSDTRWGALVERMEAFERRMGRSLDSEGEPTRE